MPSRSSLRAALAVLALASAPAALRAQATTAAPPATATSAADRAEVLAVMKRLFDAMRAGDSAAARAVFHPNAQLGSTIVRNGTPDVRLDSLATFLKSVGTPHTEVWDERTSGEIVHVDGPLAVLWTRYAFYAGSKFSHCGVDAFQMARTAAGWRIVSLIDTRQRTGCPEQTPGAGTAAP